MIKENTNNAETAIEIVNQGTNRLKKMSNVSMPLRQDEAITVFLGYVLSDTLFEPQSRNLWISSMTGCLCYRKILKIKYTHHLDRIVIRFRGIVFVHCEFGTLRLDEVGRLMFYALFSI